MKTIIMAIFLLMATTEITSAQGKVRIFNTDLDIKDIIGATKVEHQKWNLELKKVLVKNNDFPYETIGSYRDHFTSIEPNMLFNYVDKASYPLLDEINMEYYENAALPRMKRNKDIVGRPDFIKFCTEWEKLTKYEDKKSLLFKNEFIEIGNLIQNDRFSITSAPFQLEKKVTKKFSSTIEANIKANLKANNIDADATLVNYLSSLINSQTSYNGVMMIIEFRDDYLDRLSQSLNGISESKLGTDRFARALLDYAAPGSERAATTGLVVFKLDGKINKTKLTEETLKADLKTKFNSLGSDMIGNISASIGIGFVSKVENMFSAEINNTYVKNYLTSNLVDRIEISKVRKALLSQ